MRLPNRENLKRFVWEAKRGSKIPFFPPLRPFLSHTPLQQLQQIFVKSPSNGSYQGIHPVPPSHSRIVADFVVIALVTLVVVFVANRSQIYRRSVSVHAATTRFSKLVIPSPGKAPRKQLATKAARKTAQVRWSLSSSSSLPATSDSPSLFSSCLSDRNWRCQEAPQIPPRYRRSS